MSRLARVYELAPLRALHQQVRDIERAIRAGRLLPGDVLDLEQLAEVLHVRPSQLHRQLSPLRQADLIDLSHPLMAVVAPVATHELSELFRLRSVIDPGLLCTAISGLSESSPKRSSSQVRSAESRWPSSPTADSSPGALDWQDDQVFNATTQTFVDITSPFVAKTEMGIFSELVVGTERAIRVGNRVLRDAYPHELDRLAALLQESVRACEARETVHVRERCQAVVATLAEMAWYGVRATRRTLNG